MAWVVSRGAVGREVVRMKCCWVRIVPLVLGIGGLLGTGCAGLPEVPIVDDALLKSLTEHESSGLVWMFPGLIGATNELAPAYQAFLDAGIERKFRFFEWDRAGPDFMGRLVQYEDNRRRAAEVAAEIAAYRARYPDAPIDLVGYSAGAAMAVFTAEALPEDVRVRRILLAHADLSPTYDLTAALAHVEDRIIHFYSPADIVLSGGFNLLVGTMDRQNVVAAGKDGFVVEHAVPESSLRPQLEQVGWTSAWADAGHPGNHISILGYEWNRQIVAPYLRAAPDEKGGA